VRIGTAQDGTFTITNVPFGRIWLLHPTMESLASRGIGAGPVVVETKADGQIVDLGDIRLKPEHTFRGKIVLSNGKPIPPDMQVLIVADQSGDTQAAKIAPDGRFRFDALPDGIYTVAPGVQGYRLANECLILCRSVEVIVHQDITDFVIRMQPDSGVEPQK
jgi:hypothetical protein